jgi:hypothetical protein
LETISDSTLKLEHSLDNWAQSLIARHGNNHLTLIPYDPNNEYQSIDLVKLGPDKPSIDQAFQHGCAAIGRENFAPFMGDIKRLQDGSKHSYGAMRLIRARLGVKNNNVALTTNHVDLMDLALAQTALYRALEDDSIANQSGIIVNKAMTRIAYDGLPVVDLLRKSGSIYFTLPRSASAESFGITEEDSVSFNRRMGRQLASDLRELTNEGKSMLLSVAMSGSTARRSVEPYLEIPRIESTTEKFVLSRFNFVIPMSLYMPNLSQGKEWYKLHPPTKLSSGSDVDTLMETLSADTSELTGQPVIYKKYSVMGRSAISSMFQSP